MNNNKNLELLAPAGSVEKMKYAFAYGADAVYAGVPDFSLRARINDFDWNSLKEGVEYAHKLGKKFYVTLNIYAHNIHLEKLEKDLDELKKVGADAVLISDPGILELVKEKLPEIEIHLSTQANATNWRAVKFWADQGIRRVVLAREVTLEEIREIKKENPNVELEYFVHGAMCMSYSGRCMLSKWMRGRSANLGDCVQPCRWEYKKMNVIDHQGEFEMEVEEDKQGTYFFNSKDLNLLSHLKELVDAGVESFKIEGRNKSVYYLAVVVRAYSRIMKHESRIKNGEEKKKYEEVLKEEMENLNSLFHRGYTSGFLLGNEPEHNFENSHNESEWEFVGEVINRCESTNSANKRIVEVKPHNAIYLGDEIEIVDQKGNHPAKLEKIFNEEMQEALSAHGGQGKNYFLQIDKKDIQPFSLIRKKIKK
ncbi:MAG: Collagenase family protease [Candidatus Moranbacteria bacterium GW2011_GWE2_35_2-]|nr:MAG: Collagenase family protease [Candidatus Moranbacteria bacterium GW2011_GWE2_35_2-]KKQ22236.1 MAG: Collagenase family protease [Candidatus Moranbacteria bacterium GW2011_GWF2_37_11]KKQ30272.1 MAG: Collagenase family protease [Candidatus Moranbacteria bacterium GW2011_GWE1_37_24]HBO16698.1 peptidase U32 [Candidatus Moranbacteria bacterium]